MASNYSSFSPNSVSSNYYETINLVAGDTLPELDVVLRDSNAAATGYTLDPNDPTTWQPIDLSNAVVEFKFRKIGATTLIGLPIIFTQLSGDGHVALLFPPGTLDGLNGDYEGEIEIKYTDGKISTVRDLLKFNIRPDF
jgi:hypothetical protein